MRTSAALVRSVSVVIAIVSVASRPASANPITVQTGPTAAAMVANLLGNNTGITVTPGSQVYVGAPIAGGLFTGANGILPFSSGVALTSGSAALIPGPNLVGNATQINNTASDPNLDALSPGTLHGDAATLSFKFTTTSQGISFQYVFGSEEYPEFVGSQFNDVFGFFLDGVNIALIPNTLTPVTINNVNLGINSQYFTNNPDNTNTLNIQYDGLVGAGLPLFASATVTPNVEHTIKFGVEDVGKTFSGAVDRSRDSGVMLAAGSFVDTTPPPPLIPEPTTLLTAGPGLLMFARYLRRLRANNSGRVRL